MLRCSPAAVVTHPPPLTGGGACPGLQPLLCAAGSQQVQQQPCLHWSGFQVRQDPHPCSHHFSVRINKLASVSTVPGRQDRPSMDSLICVYGAYAVENVSAHLCRNFGPSLVRDVRALACCDMVVRWCPDLQMLAGNNGCAPKSGPYF